jgi:hypothetical protein
MSTQSDSDTETREFVERTYEIVAHPDGEEFTELLSDIRNGDDEAFIDDLTGPEAQALRAFLAPFVSAVADKDTYRTKERTRTNHEVQIGDEAIELDPDSWQEMMKAAANSDAVEGLQFEEVEEVNESYYWRPSRLARELRDHVGQQLNDEFSLDTDRADYTFYRDSDTEWTDAPGDQFVKFSHCRAKKARDHPETGETLPAMTIMVTIECDAEAAVDLLDQAVCDTFIGLLAASTAEADDGITAGLTTSTGTVETEVCKRTTN